MRRPTFCNNSVAVEPPRPSDKEEGRLTKVKRMFASSLRKPVVNKVFAVPLEDLPTNKDNVPKVLIKMTNYIESYGMQMEGLFRLSGGNPATVEQLKMALNRAGDADLEWCADVASVASLLKLWLRDLPEPLVSPAATAELVTLAHKYGGSREWCGQARTTLQSLPSRRAATLRHTLQLLHLYSLRQPASAANLPPVFAPLLLCAEFHGIGTPETTHVTACLIRDCQLIYGDKVAASVPNELKQRKRKERHNSDAASLDRKFVRSNSEERPSVEEKQSCPSESIRRVSSHEDFTKSGKHQGHNVCQPLHERNNWPTAPSNRHSHKQRAPQTNINNNNNNNNENGLSQLIESSPSPGYASDLFDEEEHERRRQSERRAPCVPPARTTRRRRSTGKLVRQSSGTDDTDGSSKENEEEAPMIVPVMPLSEDESPASRSTSSDSEHSFLQLHAEEKERCPSPVASPPTPPLDLSTLHEQVDSTEPLTSMSFRHQGEDRLVSPRNSVVMPRRVFSGDPPQHDIAQISQVSKRIHSLKRKLKRYEEGFEKEFGYRPSHADKLANPDTKKMCSLLTKLRKEVKTLKEEGTSVIDKVLQPPSSSDNSPHSNKEEAVHEIEKRLSEKRELSGRPERVEDMSREQLVEEKLSVQKGLLYLENTFGRAATREDRDLVRPLYDRYRALKRLLARQAPSKLKENVTELGTILEHETMDFTSSSPPPPPVSPPCTVPGPAASPPRPSTPDLENLHALPLPELLKQQQITREEKKRLRRSLREFEDECQKTVGRKLSREDRLPMEQTYTEYKHAKAKLRLLEALVMKQK